MRRSVRSKEGILAGSVFLVLAAGWLFYFFGVEAFLQAAYAGDSWSYFNEYAARWRARQADPTLDAFLAKARSLLFRYAILGTAGVTLVSGLYALRPKAFTSFFSTSTSPYNLALFRIALFGTLLAQDLGSVPFFAQLPETLQFPPPGLSVVLPVVSTDPTLASVLKLVFWGACMCGLLGLYTRVSATIALLSGLYVMGIPQLYGKVNHYHHLLWCTALLIPSRCADVLSIDAVRAAGGSARPSAPAPDRAYVLPIRYAWLLLGVLYFFPGFWKFVSEGAAWAFSENLKFQMRTHWFTKGHTPFFRVDRYPILYQAGGFFTLLFELGFVFALPFRSARPWAAGTAFLFHQSTRLFLSIAFWTLYPLLLFLLDLRSLLVRLGRRLYPSRRTLVYDPDEAWQCRVADVLLRLDLLGRLRVAEEGAGAEERADQTGGERTASLAVAASGPDRDALWHDGRFQVTTGLRLAGPVPPVLLLVPLAPFARPWLGRAPSSMRSGGTGIRALHLVGAFLVAVNVVFGLAKIKSYPFSVYPTFAVRADSTVTTLRVTARTADGEEVDVLQGVQEHKLAGFAPGRLRGLFRSIFRVDDPEERTRKLRALWAVLQQEREDLRTVTTVRFYEATYSNNPDRTSDPLLSKRLITTLDVAPRTARSVETAD